MFYAVWFWHTEGWTTRNEALTEAVLNSAVSSESQWMTLCGGNREQAGQSASGLTQRRNLYENSSGTEKVDEEETPTQTRITPSVLKDGQVAERA